MARRDPHLSERTLTQSQFACWLLTCVALLHGLDILTSGYALRVKIVIILVMIGVILAISLWWRRASVASLSGLILAVVITGFLAWYPLYYWGTVAICRPALGLTALVYLILPIIFVMTAFKFSINVASIVGAIVTAFAAIGLTPLVRPLFHQPPFHLVYGDTKLVPDAGQTVLPHSRFCHYYSTNPRGYFHEAPAADPLSPWLAWSLKLSTNLLTQGTIEPLTKSGNAIRLVLNSDPSATPSPWYAVWTCSHWRVKERELHRIHFEAKADEPRRTTISIFRQNTPEVIARADFNLATQWTRYSMEFKPPTDASLVEITLYLHPSIVPVELKDFEVTCGGQAIHPMISLSRHTTNYVCNDRGFRDRDYAIPRPDNTFRIVALGDSCTWGQGVHLDDTYSKVLEQRLNDEVSANNSTKYEVINAGRCGYSTREERLCLEQEASLYDPQLVILQMLDNDNESPNSPKSQLPTDRTDYASCVTEIKKLHQYCAERDIKLVVLLFRYLPMTDRWRHLHEQLEEGLKGLGIPVIDSGPAIAERLAASSGYLNDQPWVHPLDAHPNEIAHRVTGEALLQLLRSAKLLPPPVPTKE